MLLNIKHNISVKEFKDISHPVEQTSVKQAAASLSTYCLRQSLKPKVRKTLLMVVQTQSVHCQLIIDPSKILI